MTKKDQDKLIRRVYLHICMFVYINVILALTEEHMCRYKEYTDHNI
jgi:hypothetical protein